MSKKSAKQTSSAKKITSYKLPKRRVLIVKEDVLQHDSEPTFVQIRHPSSGCPASFLLSSDGSKVLEIMQLSDSKRSYFIDETVSSDGDLYFCTPIDPLFLALPYLMKTKKCCPVDQTLMDDEYPDIGMLIDCPMDLTLIGDRRGKESLRAYIYNEDKTLLWLQVKLNRLIAALKEKKINTSSTISMSANFVKNSDGEESGVGYMRYAYGVLLDYLPVELAPKFAEFIHLPPEPEKNVKRKEIVSPSETNGKRARLDDDEQSDHESKTPNTTKEKKTKTKVQALAKAAKGTKSISSFFKKK